jgi:hypothetical protein
LDDEQRPWEQGRWHQYDGKPSPNLLLRWQQKIRKNWILCRSSKPQQSGFLLILHVLLKNACGRKMKKKEVHICLRKTRYSRGIIWS